MEVNFDNLKYIRKLDESLERKHENSNDINNSLDKEAFLKLLVIQLANQNPLNPIEEDRKSVV